MEMLKSKLEMILALVESTAGTTGGGCGGV
jgi:hypothetical protein